MKLIMKIQKKFGCYCICVNQCDAMIPENFEEVIAFNDSNKWKTAMNREMNRLVKTQYVDTCNKASQDKKGD